ncbi:hypothetical protein [Streptomyces monomycini]|uniref:hypothetical protein n=1 Tax=Streptomyces monomycini TaxID=371720 RepID=UPI0004AB19DA
MAGRQARAVGDRLDGQVGRRVLGDPLLDVAQRAPVRRLGGELGAELRLVAGSAQEDDQVAGDVQGEVTPQVLLHQRRREVDAGGDACRGRHVAVP